MFFHRTLLLAALIFASFLGGMAGQLAVTSSVITVQAQQPQVVTASQVNIVDTQGRLRAVLAGQDERRMTSLSFYDSAGQVRSLVGIDETDTPLVRLLDGAGESRLTALVQGSDGLVIVGDERNQSGVIGAVGGSPFVSLFEAGRSRARLQLNEIGFPSFGLFDNEGRQSLAMTVDSTGAPLLTLHEQGRVRAAFGVREQTAVLNMADAQQMRLVVGVAEDGNPSISFLSENGEIIQALPLELPR